MKMFQIAISVMVMVFLSGCLPEGIELPDNNAATEQWWYQDDDQDGYGLVNTDVYGLKPGANWAANPFDCDDTNAAIKPSATEQPNGYDDDCDVTVDEQWMYVFIAPVTVGNMGNGNGLFGPSLANGPNGYCNDNKGSLPGVYRAWIATGGAHPSDRFINPPSDLPFDYVLPDGTVVANDWADLTDGTLDVAINVMADGVTQYHGYVWTSANADGTYNTANDNDQYLYGTCEYWTENNLPYGIGRVGHSDAVDAGWTVQPGFHNCTNTYAVYCVRQWEW